MQRQPGGHGEAALKSMMSWVALAGTAALLGTLMVVDGCGPQPQCANDAACGPAAKCDPQAKVCMQRKEDTSCSPACAEWEFCSESSCYPRYEKVVILEPGAGTVDGGSPVRAQLQTVAPWVQEKQTAKLEFRVSNTGGVVNSGDLLPGGGAYAGNLAMNQEGAFTLTAGFPGFPAGAPVSEGVNVNVDITAPTFTVTPNPKAGLRDGGTPGQPNDQDPQLANAYKRNDTVTVAISTSNTDLDPNSITLSVQGMTTNVPVTFTQPSRVPTCPGQAYCFTGNADLSGVEMLALRGQMTVVVTGRDSAGNLGQGTTQIPVTRFKWSRSVPGGSITASPAIGSQGTIFVGTNGGPSGSLSAIQPNGTDQWTSPVNLNGAILASPAVGRGDGTTEVVYASGNNSPPTLYALNATDGGQAVTPVPVPTSGSVTASPLVALTRVSSVDIRETATTFVNGSPDFSLASLRYGVPTSSNQLGDGGSVINPGNVVGEDNVAFILDSSQRIHEYSFAGNWSIAVPDRATTGTSTGLALTPTLVAGSTGNSVFAFPRLTGSPFNQSASSPSIPSFIGSDLVYSEGGSLNAVRVNPSTGVSIPGTLGVATTTPLIGVGGIIYFVGTNNSIHVLNSNLATIWSGRTETSDVIASSPNIDCARAANGIAISGPGTLYYGSNNGKLYAIIVDNPGIDTTSPWPKYQHDPRNTGSLSTPLSEFTCP
jgi:hypothetical protein